MDIIGNYKEVLTKKYAQFNGRAGRAEFWQFVLVNIAVTFVLYILMFIVALTGVKALSMVFSLLMGAFGLATIVPSIAVGVRRMHDLGKDGVWICVNFIPFIGGIWYIVLCATEGERTANRFGEPQI